MDWAEATTKLEQTRLKEAARVVRDGFAETLAYTRFPPRPLAQDPHQQRDRGAQQGDQKKGPGRGTFPDGKSALMLATARLKYIAESEWGSRRYLDVTLLDE